MPKKFDGFEDHPNNGTNDVLNARNKIFHDHLNRRIDKTNKYDTLDNSLQHQSEAKINKYISN
jgi:hypothetical protein